MKAKSIGLAAALAATAVVTLVASAGTGREGTTPTIGAQSQNGDLPLQSHVTKPTIDLNRGGKEFGGGRAVVDCACDAIYNTGDCVVALVDNPFSAPGIYAGDTGIVICGHNSTTPNILLISWNGWTQGHDGNGYCECPADGSAPGTSGWWVECFHVEACGEPCPADINGDGVVDVHDLLGLLAYWGPCP